ncbi:alpha/beta hydrolase [Shewanella sp. UCD-KL21]|uniref:alpha/beta hydrolase n=1 Tax=Shewanella sp. UCD-KL21 TaxID=1917164 RepID=UPI0020C95F00|nr:alpha/beta hydrolase [Shewanella sp. UCD-KL21]
MSVQQSSIQHDDSYTLQKAYHKLQKHHPDIAIPTDISQRVNISHALPYKVIHQQTLFVDIYQPKAQKGALPLVTLIHGGAWRSGNPSIMSHLAASLALRGYVVAVPSYRLSPQAQYPAAVNDLYDALTWLIENALTFNINQQQLVLAGSSAGGQLAALLAYSGGQLNTDQSTFSAPSCALSNRARLPIAALINIDGLSDFTSPEALRHENDPNKHPSAAQAWFGGRYQQVPQRWQQASPVYYIDENAPPTLFINGQKSRFYAGRTQAISALTEFGNPSKIVTFPQAPHSFWLFEPWQTPTLVAMDDFLKHNLKLD